MSPASLNTAAMNVLSRANCLAFIIAATLLTLSLLSGCEQSGPDATQYVNPAGIFTTLDLEPDSTHTPASDSVFTDVRIIPLRFKDSTLISGIDKVAIAAGSYYVLDKKFTTLYRFDTSGVFQNKIGRLGVSKGNFQSLEDFNIDYLGRLLLLSNTNQSVHYYSPSGAYLKSDRLGFFNSAFTILNPTRFLFYLNFNSNHASGNNNLLLTDSSGRVLERYRPFDKKRSYMTIGFSGLLTSYNGESLYTDAFNDTLYSIDPISHEISVKYKINFGSKSIGDLKSDHNKLFNQRMLFKNKLPFIGNAACMNSKYLVFSYSKNNRESICIVNKSTGKTVRINKGLNDGLYKMLGRPLLLTDNNDLFFAVSPTAVEYLKTNYQPLFHELGLKWPALYSFLDKNTISDNYFLLSLKLE